VRATLCLLTTNPKKIPKEYKRKAICTFFGAENSFIGRARRKEKR
jgi:hypothetical protein